MQALIFIEAADISAAHAAAEARGISPSTCELLAAPWDVQVCFKCGDVLPPPMCFHDIQRNRSYCPACWKPVVQKARKEHAEALAKQEKLRERQEQLREKHAFFARKAAETERERLQAREVAKPAGEDQVITVQDSDEGEVKPEPKSFEEAVDQQPESAQPAHASRDDSANTVSPVPTASPSASKVRAAGAVNFMTAAGGSFRQLMKSSYGRIGSAVGAVVVVLVVGLLIYANRQDAAARAEAAAAAERTEDTYLKLAEGSRKRAEEEGQRAKELRKKAAELRGEASEVAPAASSQRKGDAIRGDPYISTLIDLYPDLEAGIKRGSLDGSLGARLALMVSNGLLTPSDSRYITSFANRIRTLPD